MKIEEKLYRYKEQQTITIGEEQLLRVTERAQEIVAEKQQNIMSYPEFLKSQFYYIRKRWWILQFLLMAGMLQWIAVAGKYLSIRREMGVFSVLFVILIIPELWKNRSSQSMEVESASYYTLKQIYAARILIFTAVDVLLFSIFCSVSTVAFQVSAEELIAQCLVPSCVTACICFWSLGSRRHFGETAAIAICLAWSLIWLMAILNRRVYDLISLPVWIGILSVTIVCLGMAVYRTLHNCENCWEGIQIWN